MTTKADLIDAVYQIHGGLTRRESAVAVDAVERSMKDALASGRAIRIRGFGVIEIAQRAPRTVHDPKTGDPVPIPAQQVPAFRPSNGLMHDINGRVSAVDPDTHGTRRRRG